MQVVQDFLENVQTLLSDRRTKYHPALFTDEQYLVREYCHTLVMELLTKAASLLMPDPVVSFSREKERRFPDQGERRLHGGWEPDIVLEGESREPLAFVEYESPNSSDERVFEKDIWKYSRWQPNRGVKRAPLLIITTLKDGPHPGYTRPLNHDYNRKHKGNRAEIRENPFRYWYTRFRARIHADIAKLPIIFANFSENILTVVDIDLEHQSATNGARKPDPITDEEWKCTWPDTPSGVIRNREHYKRLLEGKTSLAEIETLLEGFWKKEQAGWEEANELPWKKTSENGFFKDAERIRNWQDAVRTIVKIECGVYG